MIKNCEVKGEQHRFYGYDYLSNLYRCSKCGDIATKEYLHAIKRKRKKVTLEAS